MIEAEGLTRHYRLGGRTVTALENVSLWIEPGDYVAVTGPTGSGKTTLMKILGCLDRPTAGRYRLQGIDVAGLTTVQAADIRNRVLGFLFQSFVLLPQSTALENVELPLAYAGVRAGERRLRARRALARVGLSDREDHRPARLSGGEQQRVAIARAVVNQPDLLLADEPTGALDDAAAAEILALFNELNQSGVTILVVTHDMSVATRARRMLKFRSGRLEAEVRIRS
ncbi:MAG TPA: ABC transporter ATP-binding protein [Xanthobacteraceae bacterium]|nr:ABC transporter ATP-binding protein [Xanthobacteraceae bacterium]